MLEGLAELDWGSIHHSHGTAQQFPGWLRQLASPNTRTRRRAMRNIIEYSNHQGSIYPVSHVIVPSLTELLTYDEIRDKTTILRLLDNLICRGEYDARFEYPDPPDYEPPVYADKLDIASLRAYGETQEASAKKVHLAAVKSVPVYLGLLDHPRRKLRRQAAELLVNFPDQANLILPRLTQVLGQPQSPRFKATALVTLSRLATPDPAYLDFLQEFLRPHRAEVVRLASALAMLWLVKEQTPVEAVELLFKMVRYPNTYDWQRLAFCFSSNTVAQNLYRLGEGWSDEVAGVLLEHFKAVDDFYQTYVIGPLFDAVFVGQPLSLDATAVSLTSFQLEAVRLVAASEDLWNYNGQDRTRQVLYHFGLPTHQDTLQAFLG